MEKQITKIELADGCIIAWFDIEEDEVKIGISDDKKEDNMFYCNVSELEMNLEAIKNVLIK